MAIGGRVRVSAIVAAALVAVACGPTAPAPAFAPTAPPAASNWSLEPVDLLRQPLEPFARPFSLELVSRAGVAADALAMGFAAPELTSGHPFVWGIGERSLVRFALERREALRLELRVHPFLYPGAPPQQLAIDVNGVAVGAVEVPPDTSEASLVLPQAALRAGWNELALRPAWARSPNDALGSADARPLSVAFETLRLVPAGPLLEYGELVRPDGEAAPALAQGGSGGLSWLFQVPADAALELAWRAPRAGGEPVSLHAALEQDRGATVLWEGSLAADGHDGARRVDLAPFAGRAVRLRLAIDGLPAQARWLWTRVQLARTGPPAVAAAAGPASALPRSNVLLVVLDAARRDRFGVYGDPRSTTPRIDAFAAESLVFDAAHSAASYTLASTVSLFTSQLPCRHGVLDRRHRLGAAVPHLAETLRDAGYATAAFSANAYVSRRFGLARGFDTFVELYRQNHVVPADDFLPPVREWLEESRRDGRPFFLYLHYIQPHAPYGAAPAAYYQGLDPAYEGPIDGSESNTFDLAFGRVVPGPRDVEQLERLYEGNLRYGDAGVGRMLDELRALDLLERTLVIVASDHGEALGDYGRFGHNTSVMEAMTAIPLVVRLPAAFPGRHVARIADPVSTIDLAPLVLESVGVPVPDTFSGRNPLRDTSGDGRAAARLLYARTSDRTPEIGLWNHTWKCLLHPSDNRAGAPALVDADDPRTRSPVVTIDLCRMAQLALEATPGVPEQAGALTPAERDALQALGYLRQ